MPFSSLPLIMMQLVGMELANLGTDGRHSVCHRTLVSTQYIQCYHQIVITLSATEHCALLTTFSVTIKTHLEAKIIILIFFPETLLRTISRTFTVYGVV